MPVYRNTIITASEYALWETSTSYPTSAQMASLSALVGYLQDRCHIPSENIIMHRHFRETECPGRNFPYYKVLAKTVRW